MPLSPTKIFSEYPSGIRMVLLMNYDNKTGDYIRDVVPYHKQASKIENKIVERNLTGKSLESELRTDEAIKLYEQNISDFADTPHPYERLRIIYTKRKQYDAAIRVCQAYIDMSKQLATAVLKELGDSELAKQLEETSGFPEQIVKIKRLQSRNENGIIVQNDSPISTPSPSQSPPTKTNNNKKIIGYTFAIISLLFCACLAFGWLLQTFPAK